MHQLPNFSNPSLGLLSRKRATLASTGELRRSLENMALEYKRLADAQGRRLPEPDCKRATIASTADIRRELESMALEYKRLADAQRRQPPEPEFVRTYNAQVHEIVDATTAAVIGAEAGLNWLRAEPPDLEEVRQALNSIANSGKRAAEIAVRLRALTKKVPTADGVPDP